MASPLGVDGPSGERGSEGPVLRRCSVGEMEAEKGQQEAQVRSGG